MSNKFNNYQNSIKEVQSAYFPRISWAKKQTKNHLVKYQEVYEEW